MSRFLVLWCCLNQHFATKFDPRETTSLIKLIYRSLDHRGRSHKKKDVNRPLPLFLRALLSVLDSLEVPEKKTTTALIIIDFILIVN